MRYLLSLVSGLLLCNCPVVAQHVRADIEQILSQSFASVLTASPYAEHVAWVDYRKGERNIYLSTDGGTPRALTTFRGDNGQALQSIVFHPDQERVYFVRGGAPNRAGEIPNPESRVEKSERVIWEAQLDGSGAKEITSGSGLAISADGERLAFIRSGQVWSMATHTDSTPSRLFAIRGSASQLAWHPQDPSQLAFTSSRGDHGYVGIFQMGNDRIKYLAPSVDRDSEPCWSPDGSKLAFLRRPNSRQDLPFAPRRSGLPWSIMIYDQEETRVMWKAADGHGSVFRSVSAPQQLMWLGDRLIFPYEKTGWTQLYSVDLAGNVLHHAEGNFEVQYVHAGTNAIVFSSNQQDIDRQHLWRLAKGEGLPIQLTSGDGIELAPAVTPSGRVYFLKSNSRQPPHVSWLDGSGNTSTVWKEVSIPMTLPEPAQVTFPSKDGLTIHGQLFLPPDGKFQGRRPAVMFFHGGSRRQMLLGHHHRQYYSNAFALNQYLAQQGFVVLSVNYRSGIGYGMEFREALQYGAQGASEYHDVLAGQAYLNSRADVDAARIGLWGGSYGGYLTALGLARNSDLFAAGVDVHGVHDWNVVIRNFVPAYNAEKRAEFAKLAFDSSPMADIDSWRSPVLVIHGDDDRNVPFSETVDLVESLRRLNVEVEQLIFPDEVHGFLLHRNWVAAYTATVEFLQRRLVP